MSNGGEKGLYHEELRLRTLYAYEILDTVEERAFDDICEIAASVCQTPTSLVTLIDRRRQWFKARVNFPRRETELECSFCVHAVAAGELMIVEDTLNDTRFENNRLVLFSPGIRFYAGVPIRAINNQPLGTLCVIDVTPRQLTEDQVSALHALARQVETQLELHRVRHQKERLGRFAIHDMRNPLTIMRFNASTALQEAEEGRIPRDDLYDLRRATERLHRQVEDLHALLASEAGALPAQIEEVDVAVLLDELGSSLRHTLTQRDIALEVNTEVRLVWADPQLLRRVIENVLYNAMNVAPTGSRIAVETFQEDDLVSLRVLDEGPGIPEEDRESIFDLDRSGWSDRRGTVGGLGLAFCDMAMHAMGGNILCEPPPPGKGASFRLTLPAHRE